MKNQVLTEGKVIPFVATGDLSAGALVQIGSLVGVVNQDVVSGATGEAALKGVYTVSKEGDVMVQGCVLYFNATNGTATTTSSTNKVIGYAWSAAAALDATVDVKLLF
jgi:predicted RecA/RadA family phage recombinase